MAPEPAEVMRSIEKDYDLECRRTEDETIDEVDPVVDFVVEDVPPDTARDLAKYVSVRGYQAFLGEIEDTQTAEIPVCNVNNV